LLERHPSAESSHPCCTDLPSLGIGDAHSITWFAGGYSNGHANHVVAASRIGSGRPEPEADFEDFFIGAGG